jgi:hypothetical protein
MMREHVLAEEKDVFEGVWQFLSAVAPVRQRVDHTGRIEPPPVGARSIRQHQ